MRSKGQAFFQFAVRALMASTLSAMVAAPLWATSITIKSDSTNVGASVASSSDPRLSSGDTSGLVFSAVGTDNLGTFTSLPPGAPSGTIVVQVPPECGDGCGQSGFVEATFTLPGTFSTPLLTGAGNVDDYGYVFLNGYLISSELTEFGNTTFSTSIAADFLPGVNTLVISDSNSGGGPSGVAFYADISYNPEPGSIVLLGSGLLVVFGLVRRKIGKNA